MAGSVAMRARLDMCACAAVLLHVDPPMWDDEVIRGLRVIEAEALAHDAEQAAAERDRSRAGLPPKSAEQGEYEAMVARELARRQEADGEGD